MRRLLGSIAAALSLFGTVTRADGTKCGPSSSCPSDQPCCSQYGECGVGAYCLGGCDPSYSHTLDSCAPAPQCADKTYNLTSLDGIVPNTKYLGDASKADWVSSGNPVAYPAKSPDSVLMTMPKDSVGTLLASTAYVWYGKISATLKTSRSAGVVTAFILLSDVKDEIDFEFVGTDLSTAQSNYYFQGVPDYTHSKNLSVDSDTFANYHTYEIDWTPDTLTWSVDGNKMRTLAKKDTWNSSTSQYNYPQTPARVQLSIWPAGLSSNGKGTVDWAGGLIDWDSSDVKNAGYFYAQVKEVSIQCYDAPSDAKGSGKTSYKYTDAKGLEDNVELSDDQTVLKSLQATGVDPNAGGSSSNVPNVPGMGTAGSGASGDRGSSTNSGGSGSSSYHGWSQGSGSGSGAAPLTDEKKLKGSMLAVLMAIAALLVM